MKKSIWCTFRVRVLTSNTRDVQEQILQALSEEVQAGYMDEVEVSARLYKRKTKKR